MEKKWAVESRDKSRPYLRSESWVQGRELVTVVQSFMQEAKKILVNCVISCTEQIVINTHETCDVDQNKIFINVALCSSPRDFCRWS